MENDLENKQMYLRTEILEKGYNAQDFFDYLIKKKGEDGGDLNNWLMIDLKAVVMEFQSSYQPYTNKSSFEKSDQESNTKNDENNNIPKTNTLQKEEETNNGNDNMKKEEKIEKKSNVYEIECKKDDNGKLSKYDILNIKLSFPEKKVESYGLLGLFSKSVYITYNITTEPINISVRRRYTDFEWLRKIFTKLFPSIFIPPIPLKTLKDNANDHKIEKRMRALERFLNNVVSEPLLKNSNVLYDFLTTEKESDFVNLKQKYEDHNFPNVLEKMQTRTGKIIIDSTILKNLKTYTDIRENFTQNQTILTQIIQSYKQLFKEMKQVSNRMLEISEFYKNIYELSVKNGENNNLCKSYQSIQILMQNWGYTELHSALNIDLEVREYFKYVKLEYNSIKDLYEKYDYYRNLYLNSKEKLINKKEKLFKEGNVDEWDLPKGEDIDLNDKNTVIRKMLPNENYKLHNTKLFLFYYATSVKFEFERLREIIGFQNKEKLKDFYNKNSKVIDELNKAWLIFKED